MKKSLFALLALCAATPSFAATTADGTTVVDIDEVPEWQKNVSLTYFGLLDGPTVESEYNQTPSSVDGNSLGTAYLYSSIKGRYNINDNIQAYVNPRINMTAAGTNRVQWLNPRAGFSHGSLISRGAFNLSGSLYAELPASEGGIDQKMIGAIGSGQTATFALGRFTLGLGTEVRGYAYSQADAKRAAYFWAYPFVAFKASSLVSLELAYEYEGALNYGSADTLQDLSSTIQPQVGVNVTENWNVKTFAKVRPQAQDLTKTTSVGLYIDGRVF